MAWLRKTRAAALVVVVACGPIVEESEDDGPPTFRYCTPIAATGVTADGEERRSDYDQPKTDVFCICVLHEEATDFSDEGFRSQVGFANEWGYGHCQGLAARAELVEHDCEEQFTDNIFGLTFGGGHDDKPQPECGADEDSGGCAS